MSDTGQTCCFQSRDQYVQVCNPCHPLTLFGWAVPDWMQIAAMFGFGAFVISLVIYLCGLSMLWWGPGDTLIKELRRDRKRPAQKEQQ